MHYSFHVLSTPVLALFPSSLIFSCFTRNVRSCTSCPAWAIRTCPEPRKSGLTWGQAGLLGGGEGGGGENFTGAESTLSQHPLWDLPSSLHAGHPDVSPCRIISPSCLTFPHPKTSERTHSRTEFQADLESTWAAVGEGSRCCSHHLGSVRTRYRHMYTFTPVHTHAHALTRSSPTPIYRHRSELVTQLICKNTCLAMCKRKWRCPGGGSGTCRAGSVHSWVLLDCLPGVKDLRGEREEGERRTCTPLQKALHPWNLLVMSAVAWPSCLC